MLSALSHFLYSFLVCEGVFNAFHSFWNAPPLPPIRMGMHRDYMQHKIPHRLNTLIKPAVILPTPKLYYNQMRFTILIRWFSISNSKHQMTCPLVKLCSFFCVHIKMHFNCLIYNCRILCITRNNVFQYKRHNSIQSNVLLFFDENKQSSLFFCHFFSGDFSDQFIILLFVSFTAKWSVEFRKFG